MTKRFNRFVIICVALLGVMLAAKVKIERIDYSNANGYAQLFLPTNQILPIPESIYPDPGNHLRVVMRIRDAECNVESTSLKFESPVIQNINISNSPGYSDIEINLKKEVSHRLFSDQQGVYIEFPIEGMTASPVTQIPAPTPAVTSTLNETDSPSGLAVLKDIRVAEKNNQHVRFELILSKKTNYHLIPIPDQPVRLAIDLKNTISKIIHKPINIQNVIGIRGARNSASVYRVVFDLEKLGDYRVENDGNNLLVEFFSGSSPQRSEPTVPSQEKPSGETKTEVMPQGNVSAAADKNGESGKEAASPPVLKLLPTKENQEASKTVAKPKDFFGTEKAKAADEKLESGTGVVTMQDEQGNEKTTFVTQTIEEGRPKYSGEPFDFNFKDTDLIDVLKFIARTAALNIAVDPDVSGKVTCEFVQVPWDQALDIFLKINGLDMILEGTVLRIGRVEKLASEAEKKRKLREARQQELSLEVATRTLSFAKAGKIKTILDKQLTPRGEIIVDDRTNMLIISEIPERIRVLDKLIDTLDTANPQVQIEARIVEASTDVLNTLGIQWGYNLVANPIYGSQTNLVFPNSVLASGYIPEGTPPNKYSVNGVLNGFAVNTPTADTAMFPFLRLGNIANTFNLDVALSGLERKGKGKVISSPKTTAQNNMKSMIEQGEKIPIQTIQNNTVTTTYISATLLLEVTPQITARGSIILDVKVTNNLANFEKMVQGIPTINIEEITSTVMVNDGSTIAIGGMYKIITSSTTTGVPLLSRLPMVGGLFRSSRKSNEQRELIIFITPRIIK